MVPWHQALSVLSPLSDTTNLASAVSETGLFDHVRAMLSTTIPVFLIALVLYTFLGAGLWNIVLAALGWLLYLAVPDDALFFDQLEHYSHYLKIAGFVLLAVVVCYIVYKVRSKKHEPKTTND